jgi:hypothetical protein
MIKDPDLEIICSRQRGRDPDTPAMKLAAEIVEHKGPGPRWNRNRLAFLAPANGRQSTGQASIMRTKPTIDEFADRQLGAMRRWYGTHWRRWGALIEGRESLSPKKRRILIGTMRHDGHPVQIAERCLSRSGGASGRAWLARVGRHRRASAGRTRMVLRAH